MKKTIFCGFVVLLISGASVFGERIFAETFSTAGDEREAGVSLSGISFENAPMDWRMDSNEGAGLVFTDEGWVTNNKPYGFYLASVESDGLGGERFVLEADIRLLGCDSIALLLGGDISSISGFKVSGGVAISVVLQKRGFVNLYYDGFSQENLLKTAQAHDYRPGEFNRLRLEYDRSMDTVTVELNGQTVINAHPLGGRVMPAEIRSAGFSFHSAEEANVAAVDNFTLTVTP